MNYDILIIDTKSSYIRKSWTHNMRFRVEYHSIFSTYNVTFIVTKRKTYNLSLDTHVFSHEVAKGTPFECIDAIINKININLYVPKYAKKYFNEYLECVKLLTEARLTKI
ncbi:MAG: hypothetical protein ACRCX2_38165 [Paraclostridium sp.]